MKHTKSNRYKKRTFKTIIKNWIWTDGTYSQITPSTVSLSKEEIAEILEIQESIKAQQSAN